jgi:hypothetical protein
MARISLGSATGKVAGAEESRRSAGATPQMSSAGALAGRSINEPALQPQAAPVNTYFQPGAPTLGGPVKVAAPPDLPVPSQDLANLARSLGGISQTLGQWGEAAVTFEKQRMADAEAKGKSAAFELTTKYPGQDFATLRDSLYKRAQEGDAQSRALYQRMQALSPLQLAYANRYVAMANLRSDLDAAGDKWARMTEVPGANGGTVPKEYLSPDDPRAQSAMRGLLRIPNDPVVWKEFEPLVYSKYTQLTAAQSKLHADWKEREWTAASSRAAAAALQSSNMTTEQKAQFLTQTLNDARVSLGPEGYQKVVTNLMPQLRASATLLTTVEENGVMRVDLGRRQALDTEISMLQNMVLAGPNGEKLVDYLGAKGGAVGIVENLRQSMQDAAGMRNDINAIQEATGEDVADFYAQQYGLNDPAIAGDAQALNARTIEANTAMANDPRVKGSPRTLSAAQKRLQSISSTAEALNATRVQENFAEQAAAIANRSDLTGEQKVAMLDGLVAGGADAKTVQGAMRTAQDERRRDNAPQANAAREMVNRIVKDRQTYLTRPGIGGVGLTNDEAAQIIKLKADLQRGLRNIEADVKQKGGSDADVAAAQEKFLREFGTQQTQQQGLAAANAFPPTITDPNKFYQQYSGFLKSVPTAERRKLSQAVQYGKAVPTNVLVGELQSWAEKNTLSPQMRFIINQAGYGNKAGEFFKKQWAQHFPGVPFPTEYQGRMNDLNGTKVSTGTTGATYSGFAMVDPLAAQRNLVSLATKLTSYRPAAAAVVAPVPVTPVRPQQIAIRPVTASIGNYAVPVSGVADTGRGYGVPGVTDASGRPVVLAQGAMNSFMQMVRDSKGAVKSSHIASAQRSPVKNVSVGGASGSQHLSGRALDIHGTSEKWIRRNGAAYGWYVNDYPNSHGGHFEYRGR